MDWEETNRQDRQSDTDRRPRTQQELRSRNARRDRPNLDNGQRRRQTGAGETGGSGTRRKESASAGRKPRRRTVPGTPQPEKRQKRPVRRPRQRQNPEAVVHWSDPKPFVRRTFYWKLAATLAVALAVVLCFSIFFKVGRIAISGTEKYTPEAVLEASGIQRGESLLGMNRNKKANSILSALPYVKEVQIGIKLPDTVNISIVELAVTYAVEDTEGRWWLMDSGCKLVEGVSQAEARNHTQVVGLVITDPQVGSEITPLENPAPTEPASPTLEQTQETVAETTEPTAAPSGTAASETAADGSNRSKVEAVREILKALEANNLMGEIGQVDVTFLYSITLQYEDRLEIRLGQPENLTYKVNYMAQALAQIADYQIGTLDVTFDGTEEARFIPQQTEMPEDTRPETSGDTAPEE